MTTRITFASSRMRKQPRQARAKATTEAVLDAAAHILAEHGWSGLTTNAVADKAGVSIGSLYQYFPNKLALIEAVRRRHFDAVLAVLQAATNGRLSRRRRIEAFVDGMIAVHSRHRASHRVLLEEAPRGEDADLVHRQFRIAYRAGCEALFAANARNGSGPPPAQAAQVLAAAVAGVVHEAAHQGTLSSPELRQELLSMVEAYLSRRRRPTEPVTASDRL